MSVSARRIGWLGMLLLGVAWLCPRPGAAATLTLVPDKTSYTVGEPVVVQILGNPEGGSTSSVFARLRFDPAVLSGVGSVSIAPTSFGGFLPWEQGVLPCGTGFCDAFNSILSMTGAEAEADQTGTQVWATVTLTAEAPGTTDLSLEPFHFFGLASVSSVPIQVAPPPPVPAAHGIALCAIALLLAASASWVLGRRVRA